MKASIVAFAVAVVLTAPAASAGWGYPGPDLVAQAQKGRHDRGGQGREHRPERRGGGDDRRDRLNDDERRALHRDLDKANRELYHPRGK
jgi:hypothetical protein